MRRRLLVAVAWAAAVISPVGVLLAYWTAGQVPWTVPIGGVDPIGVLFPAAGAFLISRRPRLVFPWLLWGTGVIWTVYLLCFASIHWMTAFAPNPLIPYVAWPAAWLWLWVVPPFVGIMPLIFPDGRLPSRRWRPVLYGNLVLMVGHSLLLGLSPDPSFELGLPIRNPFGVEALGSIPEVVESWITPPMLVLSMLGVLSLGFRYKAAAPETRRQIAWYFYTMVAFIATWAIRFEDPKLVTLHLLMAAAIPIAIIAAVLRHQLYGIDVILNRTLVYVLLAVVVGTVYLGLIWLGSVLADGYGPLAGLGAAMAAGVLFDPLRTLLQAAVDRLLNVERDPYRMADQLSRTVQEAGDPSEALATATSMVRWALGARGAGVEVHGERLLSFVDGELGEEPKAVPLAWHGEPVGRLLLAGARQGREPLSVLAKHLAELAHAVRLTSDLRRSRERIRVTRDEERRRLGRELHDGLGPSLTSVTLTLDEARRRLDADPDAVAELLVRVREEMTHTIVSVRELVYGLRPPALDDLGLEGALRVFAQAPGPRVDVRVDGSLADLPAAVEVAAYRIAQEALTNVRRHAHAASALIGLTRVDGELRVTVADDGVGLPVSPSAGVGLTSMRERAAETGGSCTAGPRPGGGTEVIARLPL
ncbi:sensor histidine kinase [Nonomuraea sp. NPDC046570]|uniref:sensor histidine kinase n=1 Tax=Nonomuraea sp. NPDC046570 TaxID=3155255 RepID=UPI0033C15025